MSRPAPLGLLFARSSHRSEPNETEEDAGSACLSSAGSKANGIPDWEDPLGNGVLSPGLPDAVLMAQQAKPPRRSGSGKLRRKGTRSGHHSRPNGSSSATHSKYVPSPKGGDSYNCHREADSYDHHNHYDQGSNSLCPEDMVIECDHDVEHCSVGEITYDGSFIYDHASRHPDDDSYRPHRSRIPGVTNPPSRARSGGIPNKHSSRHPGMTDDYMRRGNSLRHVIPMDNQENRDQGDMSLEEEERRLIELAMERSLQETSSNNSSRYSVMEGSQQESIDYGCSRVGSFPSYHSSDPRHDGSRRQDRPSHGDRHSFAWKRDGKKWSKVPVASEGLKVIKESDHSGRRLSRAERLDRMEQEMFEEAMQRSMDFGSSSSNSGYGMPLSARNVARNPSNSSLLSNGIPSYDGLEEDYYVGDEEDEAMVARLRELEEEKARLKMAIRRRSSLGKKSSGRSRSSETVSMSQSDDSSIQRGCSIYQDVRVNSRYNDIERYDDEPECRNIHEPKHHQYRDDQYDEDQNERKLNQQSVHRHPAMISRTSSIESRDSTQGQKSVWKKDRRGVWGRFNENQIYAEDDESIMADVLKRSMDDQ